MVQLTQELVDMLDRVAGRKGVSRSALIRGVLEDSLADDREVAIGRSIAAGYERVPPATPDAWGDLGGLTDRAAGDLLQRLDAEERESGEPPW